MTMIQNDVKDVDDEFVDSESDGEGEFNKRVGNLTTVHSSSSLSSPSPAS